MLNQGKTSQTSNFQISKMNNKINNTNSKKVTSFKFSNKNDKKNEKEGLKIIKKNLNSLQQKIDIKKKNCKTIIKQKNKITNNINFNNNLNNNNLNNNKINNNNQNICSSNCILPTNDSDTKDEDKKLKKTFLENSKNEEMNLFYLGNLFRTSNLKRTILIDSNGNNNLNIKKNLLNIEINDDIKKKINNPIKTSYGTYTHKKLESDNILFINNLESKNIIDENEELRLKEYGMIFNLLNDNIEDMKSMFNNSHIEKSKKKIQKENINKNKENNIIFSEKEKDEINKIGLKKNISTEIINGKSFLESCFQDDFYISLANNNLNNNLNNNYSFEFSSVITNNNNSINDKTRNAFNLNDDLEKTECEIYNYDDENYINKLKNSNFNPRFLIDKKANKMNHFSKTKTEKCIIY